MAPKGKVKKIEEKTEKNEKKVSNVNPSEKIDELIRKFEDNPTDENIRKELVDSLEENPGLMRKVQIDLLKDANELYDKYKDDPSANTQIEKYNVINEFVNDFFNKNKDTQKSDVDSTDTNTTQNVEKVDQKGEGNDPVDEFINSVRDTKINDTDLDMLAEFNSDEISNQQQNAGKGSETTTTENELVKPNEIENPNKVIETLQGVTGEQPSNTAQVTPKTTENTSGESVPPKPTTETNKNVQKVEIRKRKKLPLDAFSNENSIFRDGDNHPLSNVEMEELIRNSKDVEDLREGTQIKVGDKAFILTKPQAEVLKIIQEDPKNAPFILEEKGGFKFLHSEDTNDTYYSLRREYENSKDEGLNNSEVEEEIEKISKDTKVHPDKVKGVLRSLKKHWFVTGSTVASGIAMGYEALKNYLTGKENDDQANAIKALNDEEDDLSQKDEGILTTDPAEQIAKAGEGNSTENAGGTEGTEEIPPKGTFEAPATEKASTDAPATTDKTEASAESTNTTPSVESAKATPVDTAQAEQAFMNNVPAYDVPSYAYAYQNTPAPAEDMFMPDPKMLEYLRRVNPNTAYGIEQYYRNQRG